MMFHPSIYTRDEVDSIVDQAKASLASGQTVVQWTSLGSSAQMSWAVHPQKVLAEALLYYQMVDPTKYGLPMKAGRIIYEETF
jgi:hypothetical protein